MENITYKEALNKIEQLKIMPIGSNCAGFGSIGNLREKGPIDNIILMRGLPGIDILFENKLLEILKTKPKIQERIPNFEGDSTSRYIFGDLISIEHNNPLERKYIEEITKRFNNFCSFYEKVKTDPNCYFIYSLSSKDLNSDHTLSDSFVDGLKLFDKYGIKDKVIVVGNHIDPPTFWKFYCRDSFKYNLKYIELEDFNMWRGKLMSEIFKKKLAKILYPELTREILSFTICAVAKKENVYINDWVAYHLNLGINKIFIYDNNDEDYEDISVRINDCYKDRVEIIPIHNQFCNQKFRYNDFYKNHGQEFDWIAFMDIDEYIFLDGKYKNLQDFGNDLLYLNVESVKMGWEIYGDDGIIEGDESVPVYKRLLHPLGRTSERRQSKAFVRGKMKGICCHSCHCWSRGDSIVSQLMPDGTICTEPIYVSHLCRDLYIKHFITKTLSEYIKYKLDRPDAVWKDKFLTNFDYFFKINKRTPLHDEYITKLGLGEK